MGDEIMVTGEVKRRAAGTGHRFAIWDLRRNTHRWHEAWWGNARIAQPGQQYDFKLYNSGGMRPYIAAKSGPRWYWKQYKPEPGELFLSPQEMEYAACAAGAVVIQPALKPGASPNKAWPHEHWEELVRLSPHLRWVQVGTGTERRVERAEFVVTPTMRHAFAVLAGAKAAVLQEGGLHHAAAALGVPAVVVFGGFISPKCTGYDAHTNLFRESLPFPLGCGMRVLCEHCAEAMHSFTPHLVKNELEKLL